MAKNMTTEELSTTDIISTCIRRIFAVLLCLSALIAIDYLFVSSDANAASGSKYQRFQPIMPKQFKAYTDRTEVGEGDTFTLTLSYYGAKINKTPDIEPLNKDFDIYDSSQGFTHSNINGKVKTTMEWRFTLMPKHIGKLAIPSIRMGELRTKAFKINVISGTDVTKSSNAPEAFIRASVDKNHPFVQEQILLTIQIFHRKFLHNASLSPLDLKEALVEKIGRDSTYKKLYQKHYYDVIERKYAIFPQSSGNIKIPALTLQGELVSNAIRRNDIMGMFRHNNLANNRIVTRKTKPIELSVKPRPENYSGARWLPAKEITLFEQFSPKDMGNIKAGDALKRTIVINAKGLLSEQLPKISMPDIKGIKQYPGQSFEQNLENENRSGKQSIKQQEIVLIPSDAGSYTLPAIEVTWWNLKTDKEEKATIPEKTITVLPAENTNANNSDITQSTPHQQQDDNGDSIISTTSQTNTFKQNNETTPTEITTNGMSSKAKALILSLAAVVIFLIVLVITLLTKNKRKDTTSNNDETDYLGWFSNTQGELQKACEANDMTLVKRIIIKWGEKAFTEHAKTEGISLNFIAKHCITAELAAALERLLQQIYGVENSDTNWKADEIPQAFQKETEALKKSIKKHKKTQKTAKNAVPSLYPYK
ncbi:MAG: protein BatD [Alphaproteobacteria bacterium]|nr:protein BatD [Alphaproteobacteria bacterium]